MGEKEQLIKEVEDIKKSESHPNMEEIDLKIIVSRNTNKKDKKTFTQYKMNLPKEIIESISLGRKRIPQAKGTFYSSESKFMIEIW